ncbi:MAG: thermonuclease family protein [Candidatus Aenigmarchaeota archaeon]|nr:thermonuclease family protein [Candidatus Aenigmarchaeota archaeon]
MKTIHVAIILSIIGLVFVSGMTGFFILRKSSSQEYLVTRVIDGDTVELSDNERVRLLGINAPEITEAHYQDAKDKMIELVQNKSVTFENGPQDKDLYGRSLRYIFVNSTFVNLEMVKGGYATVYLLDPSEKYYLEFKTAEKQAKDQKLRIWGISEDGKCISLITLHYVNDEYAAFKNSCSRSIEMTSWEVKDAGTKIYKFKKFVLNGNSSFVLFSGKGTDTAGKLYWDNAKSIWNNAGDTLYLRDGNGSLVISYTYP